METAYKIPSKYAIIAVKKSHLYLIFFLMITCQAFGQNKVDKIKLKKRNLDSMVHFKSGDYIIAFGLSAIQNIYDELSVTSEIEKNDTLEMLEFIQSIDSTGKGNMTNNYRLNIRFRKLLNKGKVKIYCISKNNYLAGMQKKVDNVPGAGEIYYYFDQQKTIIQFSEAFVGTPGF